jgi:hypothetical protein
MVMKVVMEKGRIPYGCFDRIAAAVSRKKHMNHKFPNPNSIHELTREINFDPANQVLEDTGMGSGYIAQRCKDLHGKIFAQLPKDYTYLKTAKG